MDDLDQILSSPIFPFELQKIPTKEDILSSKLLSWLEILKKLLKSSLKEQIKEFIVFDLYLFKTILKGQSLENKIFDFMNEFKLKDHSNNRDKLDFLGEERKARRKFMKDRLPEKYMDNDWLENLMLYLEEVLDWKDCIY